MKILGPGDGMTNDESCRIERVTGEPLVLLLISPITGDIDTSVHGFTVEFDEFDRLNSSGNFILLSRLIYKPRELWQVWRQVDPAIRGKDIRRSWVVKVQDLVFVVAEFVLDCALPTSPEQSIMLEERGSHIMEDLISRLQPSGNAIAKWVSRTLLIPRGISESPSNWISPHTRSLTVSEGVRGTVEATVRTPEMGAIVRLRQGCLMA